MSLFTCAEFPALAFLILSLQALLPLYLSVISPPFHISGLISLFEYPERLWCPPEPPFLPWWLYAVSTLSFQWCPAPQNLTSILGSTFQLFIHSTNIYWTPTRGQEQSIETNSFPLWSLL